MNHFPDSVLGAITAAVLAFLPVALFAILTMRFATRAEMDRRHEANIKRLDTVDERMRTVETTQTTVNERLAGIKESGDRIERTVDGMARRMERFFDRREREQE